MAAYLLVLSMCIIVVAGRMVMLRCTTSPSIGTLVIMVREMGTDLVIFIELLVMIVVGFCFALVGLAAMQSEAGDLGLLGFGADGASGASGERADGGDGAAHRMLKLKPRPTTSSSEDDGSRLDRTWFASTSPFMMPVWAVLGNMDVEAIEESIMFGAPLMWIYTLIATVVLVNLLVAMFSDTYSRIKENSETEYCHLRYVFVFSYRYLTDPIPPPLNLPFSLWRLGRDLLGIGDVGARRLQESHDVPEEPHHWSGVIDPNKVSLTEAYMQRFLETKRQSGGD
jgi:hypothetical protein